MKLDSQALRQIYRSATLIDDVTGLVEQFVTGRKVLDIGCANYEGEESFGLMHSKVLQHCARCVGVDIAPAVLKLPPSDKARYYQASAESFELEERFDTIFVGDDIEHLSNPGLFLERAAKMMHSGSSLLMVTPNPYGLRSLVTLVAGFEPPIHPEHTCFFSISSMNELASRYALSIKDVFLVRGQVLLPGDWTISRTYKIIYRTLLQLRSMRKFADTLAFRLVQN